MNRYRGIAVLSTWLVLAIQAIAEPTGEIEATITGKPSADRVWAVELQLGKHIEGTVTNGKRIRVADLPLGTYGLVLKCGTHIIEGMRYPDEVYVGTDLTGDDRKAFEEEVRKQEQFFDNKTIWSIQGGSKRAIAFVFNERSKVWYDNPTGSAHSNTLIRRYDVQVLRKSGVAWLQDNMFFLWREEAERGQAKTMTHQFEEQLADIELTKEKPKVKMELKL
jgi:hypothetical protein